MKKKSILVVDDDLVLRTLLKRTLKTSEYAVETCSCWEEMSELIAKIIFDLYILDINLPGLSGIEICRSLRDQDDQTPIIMLTAMGEDNDRIIGLESGADDYLPKPFNANELLARIKAVLRRHAYIPISALDQTMPFMVGQFTYDYKLNALVKDGIKIALTGNELAILKLLHQHRGKPVSRSIIYQNITGIDYQPDQRGVDLLISKLRKMLGDIGPDFRIIQTIRGKGYMLVDTGSNIGV